MEQTPHVVILPSPGMGHLIPMVEFAKQLVNHHQFKVTIIIPTSGPPPDTQKNVLKNLPENINHIFLPPVNLPKNLNAEVQIFLTVTLSLPSLRDTIRSLISETNLTALIVDAFSTDAFDIAKEFNIPPYLIFTANALTLSFCFYLPKLDEMVTCEFRDLPEPVKIPGSVSVHGKDLLDPVQDRSHDAYKKILHTVKRFGLAKGILVNTFMELEEGAIKALQEKEVGRPPIYPVGPLIQTGSSDGSERFECLDWLDNQPKDSVLFVAFGSGGTLSQDQVNELALGLEMSGQNFLWVVRCPNNNSANAAFFSVHTQNDPLGFLPKGFLDRTRDRGLVVPLWAPQAEVLAHSSTGGFVTHCGWNSTLEGIVHGVPLIAWPLYAEQKMTAVMLTETLNVALRPNVSEEGLVVREEIEKVVKCLMVGEEGKKIRDKMRHLKDAGTEALREGGSSIKSLSELAIKLENGDIN